MTCESLHHFTLLVEAHRKIEKNPFKLFPAARAQVKATVPVTLRSEAKQYDEERHSGPCDATNALASLRMDYEIVEADERCDLTDLDRRDDENAKPDWIVSCAFTSGKVMAGS